MLASTPPPPPTDTTTTSLFWQPPTAAAAAAAVPLWQQRRVLLVDTSGSTAGAVLRDEIQVARALSATTSGGTDQAAATKAAATVDYVSWSSVARVVPSLALDRYEAYGGTDPVSWYTNPEVARLLEAAPLHVVLTDGEVPPSCVPDLTRHVGERPPSVVVTILTGAAVPSVSQLSLSVVAPLVDLVPHALLLYRVVGTDGERLSVLRATGAFAAADSPIGRPPPELTDATTLADLPVVTPTSILSVAVAPHSVRPPPRSLPWPSPESPDRYLQLDHLLGSSATEADWRVVLTDPVRWLEGARVWGLLEQLRTAVLPSMLGRWVPALVVPLVALETADDAAVTAVRQLERGSDSHRVAAQALRAQRQKGGAVLSAVGGAAEPSLRALLEHALALVCEFQAQGYRAGASSSLARTNRAWRAQRTDGSELRDHAWSTDGALAGECALCCEACGPGTGRVLHLLLQRLPAAMADLNVRKTNADGSAALGDLVQTFPLAFGGSAQQQGVFVPDAPVCSACAGALSRSPLTRATLGGSVALVALTDAAQRDLVWRQISLVLADGVLLPAWWLLWTATCQAQWLRPVGPMDGDHPEQRAALEFLLTTLLHQVPVSRTLQGGGGGPLVPLHEALAAVVWEGVPCADSPTVPYVQRYPLAGVLVMTHLLARGRVPPTAAQAARSLVAVRSAQYKAWASAQLGRLKWGGGGHGGTRPLPVLESCFDCRFGVPVESTARLVSPTVVDEWLAPEVRAWLTAQAVPLAEWAALPELTFLWWRLSRTTRPQKVDAWLAEHAVAWTNLRVSGAADSVVVLAELNAAYFRGRVDDAHRGQTEMAGAHGPSVLQCVCGYALLEVEVVAAERAELAAGRGCALGSAEAERRAQRVHQRRAHHFREVYRANSAGHTSDTSLHYCGAKATAAVFDAACTDAENVVRVQRHLAEVETRGNVHTRDQAVDLERLVRTFRPFADEHRRRFAGRQVTLAEKIDYELRLGLAAGRV
jgi:hypothetical protein